MSLNEIFIIARKTDEIDIIVKKEKKKETYR